MTSKVFCAIDTPDIEKARELIKAVSPVGCGVKFGLEFFSSNGPSGIKEALQDATDTDFFLDLKYHDIPNTVAGAVRASSCRLKPAYLNVHASGGADMMRAAKEACYGDTRVLGITVLTSLDENSLLEVGQKGSPADQVLRLAALSQEAGLDGVVCSALEIELLRKECGDDFILMVPGIRPAGTEVGDQKRIMTPEKAMRKGATHLVIGRPITKASDPAKAARSILQEME